MVGRLESGREGGARGFLSFLSSSVPPFAYKSTLHTQPFSTRDVSKGYQSLPCQTTIPYYSHTQSGLEEFSKAIGLSVLSPVGNMDIGIKGLKMSAPRGAKEGRREKRRLIDFFKLSISDSHSQLFSLPLLSKRFKLPKKFKKDSKVLYLTPHLLLPAHTCSFQA